MIKRECETEGVGVCAGHEPTELAAMVHNNGLHKMETVSRSREVAQIGFLAIIR